MALTQDDLNAFHRFAVAKLVTGGAESLFELVDDWEIQQLTPEEKAENIAAVQAALRDMQNGDYGRPADEISRELRAELADLE